MNFLKKNHEHQKRNNNVASKSIKISISFALATLLIFSSCSSDDGAVNPSASDINTTIDENPANGTSLGTVTTNLTGTLSYSISSESVTNAFAINSTTGAVTVNDGLAFDFESNPTVSATVSVTNSSETVTSMVNVTLNNVDDIASFLTTSQSAYEAANPGEWIAITETEYNALAMNLNSVTEAGTTNAQYNDAASINNGSAPFTLANNNGITIPNGGYVFAFKYHSVGANAPGNQVKQSSTDITSGYANLGGLLPASVAGNNFAVIKGNDTAVTNTGFLAIFYTNSIGFKRISGNTYNYGSGDTNDLPNIVNDDATFLYQGLSSTQKQWD